MSWRRGVKQIRMRKEHISGIELAVHEFKQVLCDGHTFRICSGLVAKDTVFEATEPVAPLEHLQAPVLPSMIVYRHDAGEAAVGLRQPLSIPVPKVLVPFPRTALPRLFEHDFCMEHVRLDISNKSPRRVHQGAGPRKRRIRVVAKIEPQR